MSIIVQPPAVNGLSSFEVNGLIGAGFLVEAVAQMPNATMIEVVSALKNNNTSSSLLSPYFPNQDIGKFLGQLDDVLTKLPTDKNSRMVSMAYLIMIAVTTAVVMLRFWVRIRIKPKRVYNEDWACLVAFVCAAGFVGLMCAQNAVTHSGTHIYLLTLPQISRWAVFETANGLLFNLTHVAVKCAFLVFYHRLYPNRMYRRFVWVTATFVLLSSLSGSVAIIFQCQPIDWWNHFAEAKCMNRLAAFTAQGICYIIADIAILVLPIPVVLTLQLRLREKVVLMILFSLGGFISIISIIRLIALRGWLLSNDFTYSFQPHGVWATAEVCLSIVVCCAPALKVILDPRRLISRIKSIGSTHHDDENGVKEIVKSTVPRTKNTVLGKEMSRREREKDDDTEESKSEDSSVQDFTFEVRKETKMERSSMHVDEANEAELGYLSTSCGRAL